MSFLDYRHPDYDTRKKRSRFAKLYRTGRVQDEAEKAVRRESGTRIDSKGLHLQTRSVSACT